jgi:hypothetical protein
MQKYLLACLTTIFLLLGVISLPEEAYAWFNSSYQYCRPLTTTAGGGSGGVATTTTTGFALVATSTISTLAATSSSGRIFETTTNTHGTTTPVDVAVTNGTDCNDNGGTLLDFYFEKYVQTTGEFVLWIEPDSVSSTTAKTVLMYYGYADASATDQSDEAGVFGGLSEYAVWNFSEDPSSVGASGIKDSTSNNKDGTDNGSMDTTDQIPGQVNGSFDFDNTDDYIDLGAAFDNHLGTTQDFSISMWTRADSNGVGGEAYFMATYGVGLNPGFGLVVFSNTYLVFIRDGVGSGADEIVISQSTTNPIGGWHFLTMTVDRGGLMSLYVDGVHEDSDDVTTVTGTISTASPSAIIGASAAPDRYFDGALDDGRFFNDTLHPMDILTIYNNTVDSTTFWTFGDEETESAASSGGGSSPKRLVIPPAPSITTYLTGNIISVSGTYQGGNIITDELGFTYSGKEITFTGSPTSFTYFLRDLACGTYEVKGFASNSIATTYSAAQSITIPCSKEATNTETAEEGDTDPLSAFIARITDILEKVTDHTTLNLLIQNAASLLPQDSPTTPPPASFTPPTRDLYLGLEGEDVWALQTFLINEQIGLAAGALSTVGPTTYFGALTKAALAEYQIAHRITPSVGYYGPVTRGYLEAL